eukprot:3068589-Alexandrium_andersonii.AAC.1
MAEALRGEVLELVADVLAPTRRSRWRGRSGAGHSRPAALAQARPHRRRFGRAGALVLWRRPHSR